MANESSDALLVHLDYIRKGVDDINARLDKLNGRTRNNEEDIAVLKDRAIESRNAGRTWGLTAGGLGTAIAAGLYKLFGGGQ